MKRRPLLLAATASMLPLGVCVTTKPRPTALVNNARLSDSLKARSFKSYKEVLLVAPLNDPRGLGGRLKTELEALGYPVRLMPADATVLSFCAAERAAVMAEEICTFGHPLSQLLGCSARRAAARTPGDPVRPDATAVDGITAATGDGPGGVGSRNQGKPLHTHRARALGSGDGRRYVQHHDEQSARGDGCALTAAMPSAPVASRRWLSNPPPARPQAIRSCCPAAGCRG